MTDSYLRAVNRSMIPVNCNCYLISPNTNKWNAYQIHVWSNVLDLHSKLKQLSNIKICQKLGVSLYLRDMAKRAEIEQSFIVDKLTNSIENVRSGDNFATEVSVLTKEDLKKVTKRNGWLFDWKIDFKEPKREVYKLTIVGSPEVVQGLISLEEKRDHVYIHLIENAPFNIGKDKVYSGVAGNLVAFACKFSFQRGHEGNVSFLSKTELVQHYIDSLGAFHFANRIMIIDTVSALKLTNKYFPKN